MEYEFRDNKKIYLITDQLDISDLNKIRSIEYNLPSVYPEVFRLYQKYINQSVSYYTTECSSCSNNIYNMYDLVIDRLCIK